ncbi:hypothetical protein [Auritidibacter ignavus]|uniref:hypothetical protein n=1 Tax=Auritidibacter ignavus TaxID=678932 RepID=UPI0024B8A345|nr:hypothetical protein [Auritidibacter ignavus]WHS28461.1 hypothetical protein QM395_01605 [Auritidibacter ignavus]
MTMNVDVVDPSVFPFFEGDAGTGARDVLESADQDRVVEREAEGGKPEAGVLVDTGESHFNYGYLWYPDQQVMVTFDVGYIPASEHEGEATDDKARERMRSFLDQYPEV